MARRRLLTILAASAVASTLFAGPAAALDVAQDTASEVSEGVAQAEEGAAAAAEQAQAVVDDTPAEAPVEQATDAVEEVADELPATAPEPEPEATPEPRGRTATPAASEDTGADTDDGGSGEVVAAGGVGDAPSLDARSGRGTPRPLVGNRLPVAPATAPGAPATDEVDAPLIAPPATDEQAAASMPTVLAQPAGTPGPEGDTPALALLALVSLVAAGSWTLGEARAAGIVTGPTVTA